MKIKMYKKELLETLKTVCYGIEKTHFPILNYVAIEAKDGYVNFRTTDLNTYIEAKTKPTIFEEGNICVDAKQFLNIVKSISEETVNLETDEIYLKIETENSNYKLETRSYDEFPIMEKPLNYGYTLGNFKETCELSLPSMKNPKTYFNETLDGLFFEAKDGTLSLVATNGNCMYCSQKNFYLTKDEEEFNFILPSDSVKKLSKILGFNGIRWFFDKELQLLFIYHNELRITCRTLDRKFPNFRAVLPKGRTTEVSFHKKEMEALLKASLNVGDNYAYLNFSKEHINLNKRDFSNSILYRQFGGEEIEIGIDAKKLLTLLKPIRDKVISFGLTDRLHAIEIITGNKENQILIMPIMITKKEA